MGLYDKPNKHIVTDNCMHQSDHDTASRRLCQGDKHIAYLEDLRRLHNQVVKWLSGPGKSFGYYGYVPLREDGTIDPEYIHEQLVGVDVFNNAQLIDKNAKTLEFRGNLVKVFKDDGKVIVYIKDNEFSYLGKNNGKSDSNLYLSEESQDRLKSMICPIGPEDRYYGYTPGQQIFGFISKDKERDIFTWQNIDSIWFKDNHSTKFVVSLLNARDQAIFTVQSAKVKGNQTNIIMGDNRYCILEVFDFQKSDYNYSGKIRLKINLPCYIKKSSKFSIMITHYNSNFEQEITTWKSPDYFYCTGQEIDTESLDITAMVDYDYPVQKQHVCGLTYVKSGKIKFTVTGINNINNGASLLNKLKFESNILDEEYNFQDNDMNYKLELPLSVNATNVTWSKSFKIKKDILYPLDVISGKITLSNAYTTVSKTWQSIKIKNQMEQAYINTYDKDTMSNNILETFDGTIFNSAQFDYAIPQFHNLTHYLQSEYLQVIPNYGLVWPNAFGIKNIDYNKRIYKRIFKGEDSDSSLTWGGTFVFGNLTKDEFLAENIEVKISNNYGQTWYNLKLYKDGNNPLGILTNIIEKDNQLYISFAYPNDTSYQHNELILFQLTMFNPNNSRITYIKLNNQDNSKQF